MSGQRQGQQVLLVGLARPTMIRNFELPAIRTHIPESDRLATLDTAPAARKILTPGAAPGLVNAHSLRSSPRAPGQS
jgi:hypothetical protein